MRDNRGRDEEWHIQTASRRMCAGVYLDESFRKAALKEVYGASDRIVAPSYGFDLIPVLVHARRAFRLQMLQDVLFTAAFATAALASWIATGALVVVLVALYTIGRSVSLSRLVSRTTKDPQLWPDRARIRQQALIWQNRVVPMIALAVAAVWFVTLRIRRRNHRWSWLGDLDALVIVVGSVVVISMGIAMVRRLRIGALHNVASLWTLPEGRRMKLIDSQQHFLCSLHDGKTPFLGSGVSVSHWSFAQRLVRPKPGLDISGGHQDVEFEKPPFETRRLIGRLREAFEDLAGERHPETRIPGLVVTDHVLIEGDRAAEYPAALTAEADQGFIEKIVGVPVDAARHHLACRVESWGGDVVTMVFVHVSLQGRTMFIECTIRMLTPVREAFKEVDEPRRTGAGAVLRDGVAALIRLPRSVGAPIRLAAGLGLATVMLRARKDRTTSPRFGVDIAPRISLREAAADLDARYFQRRDVVKHGRIIERRLLATVEDFLVAHNVDTSEFRARVSAILNAGVINTGSGSVTLENLAVGTGAQVNQTGVSGAPAEAPAATSDGD